MNDPFLTEPSHTASPGAPADTLLEPATLSAAKCCSDASDYVRRNPAATILYAVGTGLVLGLLVRALRPEPEPRTRVAQLLEDIEQRLRTSTGPVLSRTGALAQEGVHAIQDGMECGRAHLKDALRGATRRFNRFLS